MNQHAEEVRSLIHLGRDLVNRGFTLMHFAVLLRSPLAVGALLNVGILPKEDSKGVTPLHLAAALGDADVCKKIVIAYPNERLVCTPAGYNAADFALTFGHPTLNGLLGAPNHPAHPAEHGESGPAKPKPR
jgi:ankyrin repeat protein